MPFTSTFNQCSDARLSTLNCDPEWVCFTNLNKGSTDLKECFTDLNEGFTDLNEGFTDLNEGFTDLNEGFTDLVRVSLT